MTRTAGWLLSIGLLLFVGLLLSQDLPAILATLAHAGWGLLLVALFHLLPLALDAAAICVLFEQGLSRSPLRDALLARWVGESANSLMPAGQIGGPVLMARHLAQRGMRVEQAAAAITVSTTLQTFAQIGFALLGVVVLGAQTTGVSSGAFRSAALIASAFLAIQVAGFYLIQRRGLFSKLMGAVRRFSRKRDWSQWIAQAHAIDLGVQAMYRRNGPVMASFSLSLVGWIVGTGEVFLIARLLGTPVGWHDAFVLESLGQAIRGAGFAIPGALGVQEGGYLLLAPLAGLSPEAGLALSLAKRARELLLGLPGLLYLRFATHDTAAAAGAAPP
jgi:putative membrane protein